MSVKKTLSLAVCLALLAPALCRAADDWDLELDFSRKGGGSAAVRSLLVPGWGQAHNRQAAKGGTFFLAAVGGAAGALAADRRARGSYEEYVRRGSPSDGSYDDYRRQRALSTALGGFSAVCWTWAVLDAYVHGRRLGEIFNAAAPRTFEVALLPGSAAAVWRFGGNSED